jgi:hypothetical protein
MSSPDSNGRSPGNNLDHGTQSTTDFSIVERMPAG